MCMLWCGAIKISVGAALEVKDNKRNHFYEVEQKKEERSNKKNIQKNTLKIFSEAEVPQNMSGQHQKNPVA